MMERLTGMGVRGGEWRWRDDKVRGREGGPGEERGQGESRGKGWRERTSD